MVLFKSQNFSLLTYNLHMFWNKSQITQDVKMRLRYLNGGIYYNTYGMIYNIIKYELVTPELGYRYSPAYIRSAVTWSSKWVNSCSIKWTTKTTLWHLFSDVQHFPVNRAKCFEDYWWTYTGNHGSHSWLCCLVGSPPAVGARPSMKPAKRYSYCDCFGSRRSATKANGVCAHVSPQWRYDNAAAGQRNPQEPDGSGWG